jgi:hypothetical protein
MNPYDKFLKPEDQLQIGICNYLAYAYPFATVHHSPNEGKRSPFERYLIKLLKVMSGFPDLVIFADNRRILFIELKTIKNKKVSVAQKWWIETLTKFGFDAHVCYGFDEAKTVIDEYFKR